MSEVNVNVTPENGVLRIEKADYQIHSWNTRRYNITSMDSLIDVVKAKGNKKNSVIFHSDNEVQIIFDDSIQDRPQDIATYHFKKSFEFNDWSKVFGQKLSQKVLVNFLKTRIPGEVEDIENLIANIQKLKIVTEIIGDYQYDDNNNVSFFFKSKDGEGSCYLPKSFNIFIPIFNESDNVSKIEVELELIKPKSENEKPGIILTCPKLERYIKNAVDFEIEKMKKALTGYLVLAGKGF
ncbi:MAG: hypothetical protein PWP27_179 [Clostridiales bacterium]|nr:hypothetical protein [Clostridiales bacterium]